MEDRSEKYTLLLKQVTSLMEAETDKTANLCNISAAIRETFPFLWCGFYIVRNNRLVLGPFQGHVACSSIGYGKGVCGTAWKERMTIIVDDVSTFPGYIACSSLARSEIVVPVFMNDAVVAVIDIDSENLSFFDDTDRVFLESLASKLSDLFVI